MADYEANNGVAVITCQNPPVNQLSYNLRLGLFDGLRKGLADPAVKAIVIIGGGRTFPAGADVKLCIPFYLHCLLCTLLAIDTRTIYLY